MGKRGREGRATDKELAFVAAAEDEPVCIEHDCPRSQCTAAHDLEEAARRRAAEVPSSTEAFMQAMDRIADEPAPRARAFDAARFPELAAMLTIHETLDGQSAGMCARALGAAALLMCPGAFTDEQWLAILRQAQQQ